MQRIFLAILTLAVMACGGSDSPETTAATGGETATAKSGTAAEAPAVPPVSAPAPAAPAAPTEPSGESTADAADDPKAQECLDLVAKGSFEAAVPVCAAALAIDADDPRIAQALATAKSQSSGALVDQATGAATDAAAGAATDAADDAARSQVDGMTGGAAGNATE